jgi:hypothetical protein
MIDAESIVILGTGRSGTSAIAGALSAAGVWFGADLLTNEWLAAKGLYEDRTLHRLNRQLAHHRDDTPVLRIETRRYRPVPPVPLLQEEYRLRLAALRAEYPLWGVKDPYLAVAWPDVGPLYGRCLLVAVHRSRPAVVASFRRVGNLKREHAERMTTRLLWHFYTVLATSGLPRYHLDFEAVCRDPAGQLGALLDWLQPLTAVPLDGARAAEFIAPELRHFDADGETL